MFARWTIARRYRILTLLGLLSLTYWIAAFAWARSRHAAWLAAGMSPLEAAVHEHGFAYDATVAWLVGLGALHALGLGSARWRGDREIGRGFGLSLACHALFLFVNGIIG